MAGRPMTEAERECRRLLRSFHEDPVEAAFRAGWHGACEMHLWGGGKNLTEAYVAFCAATGHPLSDVWQKIVEPSENGRVIAK
jgi:hypothetical protein